MKQKKVLYIEVRKDIQKLLIEYLKEANAPIEEFGFAQGYVSALSAGNQVGINQINYLCQAYFLAGVRYGKTCKKFRYEMITIPELRRIVKETKEKAEELLKSKNTASLEGADKNVNYLG